MEGDPGSELERAWPLFGLSVAHGDLLLREATDEDVLGLARVVEDGVVEPGNERFMPRLLLGRAATLEGRFADFLRYHWGPTLDHQLSFAYFGARWATSGFVVGNERSGRLSARLGYEDDGIELLGGRAAAEAIISHRLRLSRERWLECRPAWLDETTWSGLDAAKTFLGI